MSTRLPPLGALRAFEAAARLLSFKKAAAELHVSPAAISHQIHTLEEYLGVRLFDRLNRGLSLTAMARAGLPEIGAGFQSLRAGVERMRNTNSGLTVSVNAGPALSAKWLVPRLHRFAALHPEIDVRLSASMHSVDGRNAEALSEAEGFDEYQSDADVEVRFGSGTYPGFRVDKLLAVTLLPVCSPRLLNGEHPLRSPLDLQHHALLHDDTLDALEGSPDWSAWLRLAGAGSVNAGRGSHFTHGALILQAAADGLGVALAMDVLAAEDVAAGRLATPFKTKLPLPMAYYVVSPVARADLPHVTAFRDWLLQEAQPNPEVMTSKETIPA